MSVKLPYFRNVNFVDRYISPQDLFSFLEKNYKDSIQEIGKSHLGKPIYRFRLGTGDVKIVAWSQMHGNESTATLAFLDLIAILEENPLIAENLLKNIYLDFIFMLNPDGSEMWTRRNAYDVDINRDFYKESSAEMRILKNFVLNGNYDYALNLHDQRTIFTTDGKHPATLSFLSPSENIERDITENRKKSMAIISSIFLQMKEILPNRIAKYTDEYYPTSSGDNFMKAGIPVILFEGGFFEKDYNREKTREFYTYAIFYALKSMAVLKGDTSGYETYFDIPQNVESHFDIIYRNVKLNTEFECIMDIAIQYREVLDENRIIQYVPYVIEIGDLGRKKAWEEIDCTGKKFVSLKKFPKLDSEKDFEIE